MLLFLIVQIEDIIYSSRFGKPPLLNGREFSGFPGGTVKLIMLSRIALREEFGRAVVDVVCATVQ